MDDEIEYEPESELSHEEQVEYLVKQFKASRDASRPKGGFFNEEPPEGYEENIVRLNQAEKKVPEQIDMLIRSVRAWLRIPPRLIPTEGYVPKAYLRGYLNALTRNLAEIRELHQTCEMFIEDTYQNLDLYLQDNGMKEWPDGLTVAHLQELEFYGRKFGIEPEPEAVAMSNSQPSYVDPIELPKLPRLEMGDRLVYWQGWKFKLQNDEQAAFLSELIKANGEFVTFSAMKKNHPDTLSGEHSTRIMKALLEHFPGLIASDGVKGYRWVVRQP